MTNIANRLAEAARRDALGIPVRPTMLPKYPTWVAWVTAMTTPRPISTWGDL